MYLFILLLF